LTIILPILLAIAHAPIFGGAKPVPYNPNKLRFGEWGSLIVAIAGPLTNLLIAFVTFGIAVAAGYSFTSPNNTIVDLIIGLVISVNLGFFIFNMLPIPPLDGSRVLYALAPDFVRAIMDAMESFGILIIFALMMVAGPTFGIFISSALEWFINFFAMIFGI
jgi:Zn-dependent protease